MRVPGGGKRLLVGIVSQLAIFSSVYGIAYVPKQLFDKLLADQGTKSAFTDIGIALNNLVEGVLNSTGSGDHTLPSIVDRFTTKLMIAEAEIKATPAENLQQYGFTSPTEAKKATDALMQYRGYITQIPQTPVLPDFLNQLIPIPQDFWNPNDKTPEKYSIDNPPQLFPLLEKMAKYFETAGVEFNNYREVIQWLFLTRYDGTNDVEELDMDFYDQFMDGIRALNSNVYNVLERYINIWLAINAKYTFGGGLDSSFYEDQRELQAYLETRWVELKAVMTGFWQTGGFTGMVRIYEPYVEPPPKVKKKKGKEPASS
ncbi:hypothetical protein TWF506_010688 [Arthrobotrys conoides]|uniref:Uncharacterized protein n=1 Tax=Arthrobotrys conoides TaxID=74498 RepID=A0AAN8RSH2_9PEZI